MAQFTRTNGDFKGTLNFDSKEYTNTGVNEFTVDESVQGGNGPRLDFFTANTAVTPDNLKTLVNATQQLGILHIYEVATGNTEVSLGIFPTGAYTATSLETVLTDAGLTATVTTGASFS